MRVNPVTSAGRAKLRRKRPSAGEAESEQSGFASYLPVPLQPELEREQVTFSTRYRPNSIFLAHLIAARDGDPQNRTRRRAEPLQGVNSYRATAALPRQRAAGHLLKTER